MARSVFTTSSTSIWAPANKLLAATGALGKIPESDDMSNKVLVVENEASTREGIGRILEASGYEPLEAELGETALQLLETQDAPLVIASHLLPDMEAGELCRRIKGHPGLRSTYVILLTAREGAPDGMEISEAGFDDLLYKPIDEAEVLIRVQVGERVIAQQDAMQNLACIDPLTCLRNKRAFENELESEIARLKRYNQGFSLLLLEVDNIEEICDMHGPKIRDEVIRLFGQFILSNLRLSDYTYRVGESRFAVILPQVKEMESEKTIERLRRSFASFVEARSEELPMQPSFIIGSAIIQDNATLSREQIIHAVETVMYIDRLKKTDITGLDGFQTSEGKGSVLVVDDEASMRSALQKSLSAEGYRVLIAEDGESCLEILKREEPEVMILAWMLPNMDGMEVCRRVRRDVRSKPPYIIVATIIRGAKSRIHALNTGADDYMTKPIDTEELLARVRVGMRIEGLKRQIARAEKLEGVMQMAGAVAHELSQPLTALMGLADLALMQMDKSDSNYRYMDQIVKLAQKLGELVKRIGGIMKYETMDYVGLTKIVDINKASIKDQPKKGSD